MFRSHVCSNTRTLCEFTNINLFPQLKIKHIQIKQSVKFDQSRKGCNSISQSEIRNTRIFSGNDALHDVTIVTGLFQDCDAVETLLLMRFHNLNPRHYQVEGMCPDILFKKCMELAGGKRGYDVVRVGGSSGLCDPTSDDFKLFISRHSSFPRKASGVKFIQNGTQWNCYYIGRDTRRNVKVCIYGQPRMGGSFDLPTRLMHKNAFPFLTEFMDCKAIAALLLQVWNAGDSRTPIQPDAVENEVARLETICLLNTEQVSSSTDHLVNVIMYVLCAQTFSPQLRSMISRNVSKKEAVMRLYSTVNKHTIVCHPVGFHIDRFNGDAPSLENKVCFNLRDMKGLGEGRGGSDTGGFVYALLDWEHARRNRRRIYVENGGVERFGRVCNRQRWQAFCELFNIDPNAH